MHVCNVEQGDIYLVCIFSSSYLIQFCFAMCAVCVTDDKIWSHEKGWVMQHVRADQQTFTNEILEAGFTLAQEVTIDTLTENYFLIFTNP